MLGLDSVEGFVEILVRGVSAGLLPCSQQINSQHKLVVLRIEPCLQRRGTFPFILILFATFLLQRH